jgi:LuxR family maltose regulon positive regulatory protein
VATRQDATAQALPRGTVTFLFTDIEGSVSIWEKQPGAMKAAVARHHAIVRQTIEANGGVVLKIIGDAFQAAFALASQGLAAALATQRDLRSAEWPETGPLRVRMGLHTGPAELVGDEGDGDPDYAVSHTLNRTARVMAAGHGGQILLSQETANLVCRDLPPGVSLKDLGEHRLKGLVHPEHLFQVLALDLPQDFQPLTTESKPSTATPLLNTKLFVPPVRSELVPRSRLLARLDSGIRRKLILVSAPAGFGKTTLVSSWLAQCQCPVAWVSLDSGDNDPVRFLSYVIAALRTISPGVGKDAQALLRAPQLPQIESVLTLLINELCSSPGMHARDDHPCVLALDDYQVIDRPTIHNAMVFLLDNLPPDLLLVITTRADPPFPLSRWRARGQMVEIRDRDLRFTAAETAVLLNEVIELNLSAEEIAALEARTEGWAAGLQMAALSLRGQPTEQVTKLVQAFTGSHHYIMDYLVEEVLERQPAQFRTFLLRTSILDRLTGTLCEAVTEQTDGQRTLQWLDKANLFLVPLDEERRWYRYHRLFRGLLRHQLQSSWSDLVPELHRRASQWHEAHGYTDEAIQHALAAEDWSRAAALMDDACPAARRNGEFNRVLAWARALPKQVIVTKPRFCVYYAWAVSITGQFDQATTVLAQIEPAIQDDPALRMEWVAVKVFTARTRAEMLQAIDYAQETLAYPETQHLPSCGPLLLSLSIAYRNLGKSREAGATALEAIRFAERDSEWHARAFLLGLLGMAQAAQGNLHRAFETYQQAIRPQPNVPTWAGGGFAQVGLAALFYEWNDLDRAVAYALEGLEYSQLTGHGEIEMNCYRQLACIYQAQGDSEAALEALDRAEQVVQKHHLPNHLFSAHMHIALARGDLDHTLHWSRQVQDGHGASLHYSAIPVERAKLALATGDKAQARAILAQRYETATQDDIRYAQIEIRILQALAAADEAQALDYLSEALVAAQPEGYVRVFIDVGTALIPLLRKAANKGVAPDYVAQILSAWGVRPELVPPTTSPLIEPLSERELEVLQLVAIGLSNREIAERLFLATGTVKKHLSNIFGKLDAQNRTECVARARELGLLE